jgi:putative effector of murein hydrolase
MHGWMDGCLSSADWFAVAITSEIRTEERILATFVCVCGVSGESINQCVSNRREI